MMQKLWQKKLKLLYSKDVLDIVQFGSSIHSEEPRDIDIAVFFQKIPLKQQLEQAQEIKKQLQKISDKEIHITSFDFYSLFDEGNFAREGILLYGKSLLSGDYFAKKLGLNPRIQIIYSLKKLEKKDKIRFNYTMNGKRGKYGLLRETRGKLIAPGVIEILPEYETLFVNSIKEITPDFNVKKVLIS